MIETIIFFIFISLCCAFFVAEKDDRSFLLLLVSTAWLLGLPLLSLVNNSFPFSGDIDDWNYFQLAATPIHSLSDAFNFSRFQSNSVQPGYPWLLSIVNHFSGHDLYTFKSLNILFLILLSLVWYRIATLLEGNRFGKGMVCAVLLCTPLWFYIFILRKDLPIVLLHNLFILGLIEYRIKNSVQSWLILFSSTILLVLFRVPLVLINLLLISASIIISLITEKKTISAIIKLLVITGLVTGTIFVLYNPYYMSKFGIFSESRQLNSSGGMIEMAHSIHNSSTINRTLFPLLYVLTEISGLNPNTWQNINVQWLRGITAIPWIILGIPLLCAGLITLIRNITTNVATQTYNPNFVIKQNKINFENQWIVLFLFILTYFFLSWQVGDTTRWRLPDIPPLYAIALYGWYFSSKTLRNKCILIWLSSIGSFLTIFYLLREL